MLLGKGTLYKHTVPRGPGPPHCRGFTITLTHTTFGRTPSERVISPSQRSLLLHTTLKRDRHPCPPAGFEPAIPASEWPQTHALDRAVAGIGTGAN